MNIWLESFGYFGVFLGAVLEGEVLLISALQTARLGFLNFNLVLLFGFLGATCTDWTLFLLGRHQGQAFLEKNAHLMPKIRKMDQKLQRYGNWLLLFYRFMYGFRIVLPVVFGLSSLHVRRFALVSFLSTLLWIILLGTLGHFIADWLQWQA